ncbi:E3 ubiquitin-protein ligase MARCHF2-like [Venturia canescens]|uniref:E3 ubiquitin-protein ligase MARCHF2-like n=1 Tax=Venturia canescens TaxID=32260 RepID=UPI001C9C2A1D|nr:E3 ubiquitin-protein ligase MARCHF2-like [Venturia canescens]
MIRENASVASTLDHLLEEVEIECEATSASENIEKSVSFDTNDENVARKERIFRRSTASGSSEISCRICYDTNPLIPITFPCKCKGTMGAIHLACLERWLEESNRKSCELCGHEFEVERTPRHPALRSIIIWMCLSQRQHQLFVRSFRLDLLRCMIITPITIVCSYVCVVAADFYSKNTYDNFPPARWTTYSLFAMMILLVFSFFIWIYMAIQYHQRVWYYWWQKTSAVRVKLPPQTRTSWTKSPDRLKSENDSYV